jgi:hypothetical protein
MNLIHNYLYKQEERIIYHMHLIVKKEKENIHFLNHLELLIII